MSETCLPTGGATPPPPAQLPKLTIKGEGHIYIVAAMDIAPLFKDKVKEDKKDKDGNKSNLFYKLRHSKEFIDLVEFGGLLEKAINARKADSDCIFELDMQERKLEKKGYEAEIFRGNLYNEFFTPIYKIKKEQINTLIENAEKKINDICKNIGDNPALYEMLYKGILNGLREHLTKCNISVKLSLSGIGYMFLERSVEANVTLDKYQLPVQAILTNPYSDFEKQWDERGGNWAEQIMNKQEEQVFNTFLWAATTLTISSLLETLVTSGPAWLDIISIS